MAKLYWRIKKKGKWSFTAYEGFDDVYNLERINKLGIGVISNRHWDTAAAEMMLEDYRRVLRIQEEEEE